MIRMLVTAPASGGGKTSVCCALLRALDARGLSPCAFKCGPDYIDPMFHRAALGVESHNLDLFLCDAERLRAHFARCCAGHGAAIVEGAMGYYDGVGLSDTGSAWDLARTLEIPALLVLPARGAALTLAATVRGLRDFRARHGIAAVLLNECSPVLCERLSPVIEAETGIPVVGCLPRVAEAAVGSRHLGLETAEEIGDLDARLAKLRQALEEHVDLDRLCGVFDDGAPRAAAAPPMEKTVRARIAVSRDEAFSFTYIETLETLISCGAQLVYFSPLRDAALPEGIGGLYLPGGYPELHARALAENESMRRDIAAAVRGGLPTVAECGGFLYLGESLADETGQVWPMAGVLPGRAAPAGHLVRFGYKTLCAETDSLLFRRGERVNAHEFHYWDTTENGTDLRAEKNGRSERCGFVSESLYAAFPHLYFAGRPELAQRFVDAARRFGEMRNGTA